MVLIELSYLVPAERVTEHVEGHRAFLRDAYEKGHFLASGPTTDGCGGAIVAAVATTADAERICAQDPFYREKIARYRYTEVDVRWRAEILEGIV